MTEFVTKGFVEPFGYGLGYPDWLNITAPAAGLTFTHTIGGSHYERILAARATFTSDANAANRLVTLDFVNARGTTFVQNGASTVITANTTGQVFEWDIGRTVAEWNANTPIWSPLARFLMPPAFTVVFNVSNIQVGDQLTGLSMWVEKFPTGKTGYPTGDVRRYSRAELLHELADCE